MAIRYLVLLAVFWHVSGSASAQEPVAMPQLYDESLVQPASDNLRTALDMSIQQWHNFEADQWLDQYVLGLDLHKVFSNDHGDIGTLILQPYVVWLPGDRQRPPFFDGNDATLTWRIANFNLIVLPRGHLNVRLGHFEIPFGLEHEINTNGTLRQYSNGANLGAKADWGLGINGQFQKWQYEVGLTRGTGQEYHSTGDPYAVSARVSTPFERNLSAGLSLFQGRLQSPAGLTDRERIGADVRWSVGPYQLMAEASFGKDAADSVRNWLTELNWTNTNESVLLYVQDRRLDLTGSVVERRQRVAGLGIRWLLGNRLTLAAQFNYETRRGDMQLEAKELRFHVRLRI